jgi:predicted outer membrane protein
MAGPFVIRSTLGAGILALGCAFAGVGIAAAQDRAPTVPESIVEGMQVSDPLAFQATAAAWNTFFVRASELALERSTGDGERVLAQELVNDHAALVPALAEAAEADALPTAPVVGLDGRQSGMMGRLEAAPDQAFDRLYLDMLLTGYDEAYGLFSGYAANGTGSLQAFAAETLPMIEARRASITTLVESAEPS